MTALFVIAALLEFVPAESEPVVFADRPQHIRVGIHNPGDKEVEADATNRIYQLAATSALPVGGPQPWKRLHVLAHQTVLEDLPVTLPAVRSTTQFRIECAGIGRVMVTALPADALKRLAGEDTIGVFDPGNTLEPAFKAAGVEFVDFEIEPRDVKLAFVVADKMPESVATRVKKGMPAVWFKKTRLAYATKKEAGTVVVAPPATWDSAAAQANLLRYAELALTPDE